MTGESSYGTGSVNFYAGLLWAWTLIQSLMFAFAGGQLFRSYSSDTGQAVFNWKAAAIGFVVGALFCLPYWALFGLGAKVLKRFDAQASTRAMRARVEAERAATISGEPAPVTVAYEPSASGELLSVELTALLADPEVRAQAANARKLYGRKVAAQMLTRKAQEAGHAGFVVGEGDLPADL